MPLLLFFFVLNEIVILVNEFTLMSA